MTSRHLEDTVQEASFADTTPSSGSGKGEPLSDPINPSALAQTAGPDEEMEKTTWMTIREYCRDGFGEFLGTMVLLLFGNGSVAQVVLADGKKGDYTNICWGWGFGVMFGVYCAGSSGGHLNPAVTLCNCVFRGFPWKKFPVYFISQFLGGMVGAAIVYGNYRSAFDQFEGGAHIRTVSGDHASAGVFCTYPAAFMTRTGMVFSEVVASAILQMVIFALTDKDHGAGPLTPFGLLFLIYGIGACFGWETGYAINFARDFGPRLVSYMIGYGHEVWSFGGYYFWIPMIVPFIGCLLGGFLYDTLIYTGPSPINKPYWGFQDMLRPRKQRQYQSKV